MKAEFLKTGERRYAVIVTRPGAPDLEMNPAPGFDPLMPHDLLHFIVERELGIAGGVFGQVAGGGTAGTFRHRAASGENEKNLSRLRRKTGRRGEKMLKNGLDDCARSERATGVCLFDWHVHNAAGDTESATGQEFEKILRDLPDAERKSFTPEKLASIRTVMDDLSRRWSQLKAGESLTLEWRPPKTV